MSNTSNPIFNPSCPSGGQYYACGNGAKFIGCCASDPCNDAGCSAGNLRAMSFDPAYWGKPQMPDQQCSVAGQQWWSCAATDPPFLSCCTMNPCTSGCPQANLIQGTLSNMASVANAYDPQPPLPSASSTIGNSTNNNSSHGSSTSSPPSMSTAAIVGIAVGGSALVLFVVAIVWWWRRRLQYRKRESSALNPVFSFQTGLNNDKTSNYRDTSSEASYSAQSTPLPVYDFHEQQQQCPTPQHQQTVHEADPANQVRQSPNFASPTSSYTFSPGMSNVVSPSYYPQPPSELVGDSGTNQHSQSEQQQLTSLGLQSFNATNPTPAELGDSKRGTGDGRGQQKVAVGRWWVASTVDVWSSCSVIRIYAHLFGSI